MGESYKDAVAALEALRVIEETSKEFDETVREIEAELVEARAGGGWEAVTAEGRTERRGEAEETSSVGDEASIGVVSHHTRETIARVVRSSRRSSFTFGCSWRRIPGARVSVPWAQPAARGREGWRTPRPSPVPPAGR